MMNGTMQTAMTSEPAQTEAELPEFFKPDWREHYKGHLTSAHKRLIYSVVRPILSWHARRHVSSETLAEFSPDYVFIQRGWPLEWLRRWGARHVAVKDATILVQGTGTGWDTITWAALRPKRIIATDLFSSPDAWEEIAKHCRDIYGVQVDFREAALEDHGFLADASIDLCASDAVLEHVRDMPSMMAESHRLLRPGGTFYAVYGPLWYSASGDHFSGRSGLEHVYNHIALSPEAYRAYIAGHRQAREDWQSAIRYLELDLFSRWTTRQYVACFRDAGFTIDRFILALAHDGIAFKARFPDRFDDIARRNCEACRPDDLLIAGNFVRLIRQ